LHPVCPSVCLPTQWESRAGSPRLGLTPTLAGFQRWKAAGGFWKDARRTWEAAGGTWKDARRVSKAVGRTSKDARRTWEACGRDLKGC